MNKIYIILVIVIFGSASCSRITRGIKHTFKPKETIDRKNLNCFDFKEKNLFVMSIQERWVVKIPDGDSDSVINEIPYREFSVLTTQTFDTSENVVDEVYFYLNEYEHDRAFKKGKLLYFINTPLISDSTKTIFNNEHFISMLAIREMRVGEWEFDKDTNKLVLQFDYEGKKIVIKGIVADKKILLQSVTHPKPNRYSNVPPEKIPEVNTWDILEVPKNHGLTFHQNYSNRRLVYPDRNQLGRKFENTQRHHKEVRDVRFIDSLYICDKSKEVYFRYLNPTEKEKLKFIKFQKDSFFKRVLRFLKSIFVTPQEGCGA